MGFSLLLQKMAQFERGEEIWNGDFRLSVDKTKTMCFTRKIIGNEVKMKLYNQDLERVKYFTFLGIWLDKRLTWAVHIQKIVDKCKKLINIMRCLGGSDWGAEML